MIQFFKKKQPEVIEKIVEKTVYKDQPMTEQEHMLAFAEFIGDISETKIEPEYEDRMFKEMENVDYLRDYLKATIARDMQRYFAATNDEQRQLIKGAISRTAFLRARLADKKDHEVVQTKVKGLRYAA